MFKQPRFQHTVGFSRPRLVLARLMAIVLLALTALAASGCSDDFVMVCMPGLYRCGGEEGHLLQRCDSTAARWETLLDCQDMGERYTCDQGSCVNPDADGDQDSEQSEEELGACMDDLDCQETAACIDDLCVENAEVRYDLDVRGATLVYRNDSGRIDLYDTDGAWLLKGGYAETLLDELDEGHSLATSTVSAARRSVSTGTGQDQLGRYEELEITLAAEANEPEMRWVIRGYNELGFYTFRIRLINDSTETIQIAKLAVLKTEGSENGGLWLGNSPATHRIWENGSHTLADHVVEIRPGDTQPDVFLSSAAPGDYQGYSASNWNHLLYDLDSQKSWVAGALTTETSSPIINLSYEAGDSLTSPDGRSSFSYFSMEAAMLPHPKPVTAGERFSSERYYVHPSKSNPLSALENYALTTKQQMGIVLWTERKKGNRVPNGWNSWSGSSLTGGYGTDITEEIILANLDVMASEFKDWGIDWFQVDDGYQSAYGDWWWREDRFPHGPKWLSDQIRARGFKPGLWMAPFTFKENSETAEAHPNWIADKSPAGALLATQYDLMDLTNPEARDHIRELFRTFTEDWGFDWLKMDFSYWALLGDNFYDPSQTREEAYRSAAGIIREQLGDDRFFLAVSAMGAHYGIADADRITMDNAPVWDFEPGMDAEDRFNQQGMKPTMRTVARRYYLHNRLWINHPDLIIFRSNTKDDTWPRISFQETQAFCSFVGLSGGIVKMGDKLVDMGVQEINAVRKLLPIYGKGARPLDILEREYPQVWHLPISSTLDGYGETYDVIGLFNWGMNWDMTQNPYVYQPDELQPVTYNEDLRRFNLDASSSYLAYEFWTETFLGELTEGTLQLEVPSHAARVVALRKKTGVPQFLGWNRQITMGATDLKSVSFDTFENSLTVSTKVAKDTPRAPFTYRMSFYVPEGYAFDSASYSGDAVSYHEEKTERGGRLLKIAFIPTKTGNVTVTLAFK